MTVMLVVFSLTAETQGQLSDMSQQANVQKINSTAKFIVVF